MSKREGGGPGYFVLGLASVALGAAMIVVFWPMIWVLIQPFLGWL